jgi:ribonuclease T2
MVLQHEWSTHGTCYNTLRPSCLPHGSPEGAEAVIFFQRVVALFRALPTYEWLASQGITPSNQELPLDQVIGALRSASGVSYRLSNSLVVILIQSIAVYACVGMC